MVHRMGIQPVLTDASYSRSEPPRFCVVKVGRSRLRRCRVNEFVANDDVDLASVGGTSDGVLHDDDRSPLRHQSGGKESLGYDRTDGLRHADCAIDILVRIGRDPNADLLALRMGTRGDRVDDVDGLDLDVVDGRVEAAGLVRSRSEIDVMGEVP